MEKLRFQDLEKGDIVYGIDLEDKNLRISKLTVELIYEHPYIKDTLCICITNDGAIEETIIVNTTLPELKSIVTDEQNTFRVCLTKDYAKEMRLWTITQEIDKKLNNIANMSNDIVKLTNDIKHLKTLK
jgi:hypothetical protein